MDRPVKFLDEEVSLAALRKKSLNVKIITGDFSWYFFGRTKK